MALGGAPFLGGGGLHPFTGAVASATAPATYMSTRGARKEGGGGRGCPSIPTHAPAWGRPGSRCGRSCHRPESSGTRSASPSAGRPRRRWSPAREGKREGERGEGQGELEEGHGERRSTAEGGRTLTHDGEGGGGRKEGGREGGGREPRTFSKNISSEARPARVMQTMSMICSLLPRRRWAEGGRGGREGGREGATRKNTSER